MFERNAVVGSFLVEHPRHGQLISLNKRNTGRDNPEFNMRHDWNSLLDSDVPPMTTRTKDRWPRKELLTNYLADFAQEQVADGKISFQTTVKKVSKAEPMDGYDTGFTLDIVQEGEGGAQASMQVSCPVVISAMGLGVPVVPKMIGAEHAETYADVPEDQEKFEKKTVLVWGMGNAGFETANAMAPYVDFVHVFAGRPKTISNAAVSWEARYPGAVRAINAALWDSYLLKSLDGGMAAKVYPENSALFLCGTGRKKKCIFPFKKHLRHANFAPLEALFPNEPLVTLGHFCLNQWENSTSSTLANTAQWAEDFVKSLDAEHPGFYEMVLSTKSFLGIGDNRPTGDKIIHRKNVFCTSAQLTVPVSWITPERVDDFAEIGRVTGGPYPLTYDHVIFCLGWNQDLSMYDEDAKPLMQPNKKFAVMDDEYQSVNVPGLYFAGALSHGKDFKRSAGGFIHGFRYTARALYNILMVKYEDTAWPSTMYEFKKSPEHTKPVDMLTDMFISQIDEAAAPYQMISTMVHGVIFECEDWPEGSSAPTRITAKYVKDMPWDYFNLKYRNHSRVAWMFSYDGQRRRLSDTVAEGTRHEVHIWEFEGPCDPPAYGAQDPAASVASSSTMTTVPSKNVIVLDEQLHVEWNTPFHRAAILRMFQQRLSSMMNQAVGPEMCVEQDVPYSSYIESTEIDQWHIGDVWFNVINDLPIRVSVAPSNYHWDPETQTTSGSVDEWQYRAGQHLTTAPTWWQNVTVKPTGGAQVFGMDDQLWNFSVEANPADMFRSPCSKAGIAQWRVDVTRGKVQDVLLSELTAGLPCRPFFTTFDADGDGGVGAPELQAGFRRAGIPMDENLARKFIAIVDKDKDGTLAEREFLQILAMMKSRAASEYGLG
jgi:thioredoxin reductase